MYRSLTLLAASFVLAACQDFGGPIEPNRPPSPQEQRLQALESKLGDVTRKVDNLNLAAQTQGLTRLEAEVRELRGEVERMRYDIEGAERRNRELYQDLDRRLQRLENESRPARLAMEPKIANAPPVPADQEEEAAYLAVFEQLKAGKYDAAISGYRNFLQRWPQGRYADNARYWLGESHYVKRDYDAALAAFRDLLEQAPTSQKAPDAMLKIGMAQIETKQPDDARATFRRLISEYPNSNAAGLARQRLEQLK